MRSLYLIMMLGTAACVDDGGPLAGDFERAFTAAGGCRDVEVYVTSANDDIALRFEEPGLLQAAIDAGGAPVTLRLNPQDLLRLDVRTGTALSSTLCSDGPEPEVTSTYVGITGTAIIDIRPNTTVDDFARLDLQLVSVAVLDEETNELLVINDFTVRDIAIGFTP
ncbi:MAG: hypothetical protein ACJAZO_004260 [Myxococcota bacterium]|jgi:hypothetical protein